MPYPPVRARHHVPAATPPMATQRIEELIANYKRTPERYYRETPFHGTLFFKPGPHGEIFVGSNRIKRVRRLAEKSSRRIIDHIFLTIKQHADQLAADRARRLSVSRDRLISNPEEMLAEFIRAEQRLLDDLRFNRPISFDEDIQINDVAGVKVILEHNEYDRIQKFFSEDEDCEIVEEEPHFGNYNAVNLIVRYRPNKEKVLARPLGPQMLRLVERRGLDPAMANREFASFVHTGEESVNIEVIVSNYEEMLESEIGRCIHEDRIIEQRMQQEYRGPLAKNVEYLMVYLFNFAVSPQSEIGELPIKLWNRYLPDYIDEVLRALFKLPPLSLLD